jgi:hypothetical protein
MGSDCGKIPVPDMHSCCRTATPSYAVVSARTDYPEQRALLLPANIPDLDELNNYRQVVHWQRFESATPPPLISRDSFDILRI